MSGVIFVLSVMRVVGGVPLWVECVFRRVDVVCLCLLYTQLLFCGGRERRPAWPTNGIGKGLCKHNLCNCLHYSNIAQAVSSWNYYT